MLRLDWTYAQSCQILRFSHTQIMELEEVSDQKLDLAPLDTSVYAFKGGFTKLLWAGLYVLSSLINTCPAKPRFILFENTVDSDKLASGEAIRSGSTLFSTLIKNTYLQLECCRWIG